MPPRPANPVPPSPARSATPVDAWWWLAWLGLAGLCVLAYLPAVHGGFRLWDDNGHVTQPELRSLAGLGRIWFEPGATQQYYPVLHSAFWVEHRLWGENAAAYHWLNVLLHVVAAGLLVRILQRLAIPGAWLAGLVFALHPVCHVETVARGSSRSRKTRSRPCFTCWPCWRTCASRSSVTPPWRGRPAPRRHGAAAHSPPSSSSSRS